MEASCEEATDVTLAFHRTSRSASIPILGPNQSGRRLGRSALTHFIRQFITPSPSRRIADRTGIRSTGGLLAPLHLIRGWWPSMGEPTWSCWSSALHWSRRTGGAIRQSNGVVHRPWTPYDHLLVHHNGSKMEHLTKGQLAFQCYCGATFLHYSHSWVTTNWTTPPISSPPSFAPDRMGRSSSPSPEQY